MHAASVGFRLWQGFSELGGVVEFFQKVRLNVSGVPFQFPFFVE